VVKVTREVPPASVIAASEIVISVESPAVAPAGNRKAHRYVTRSAD
jgi:hypothetical protein